MIKVGDQGWCPSSARSSVCKQSSPLLSLWCFSFFSLFWGQQRGGVPAEGLGQESLGAWDVPWVPARRKMV